MTTSPRALLLKRHRIALWQRPLWVGVGALMLDPVLVYLRVAPGGRVWLWGAALVAAAAARFLFPPKLRDTARGLDARAGTHNRLEAVAALGGRTDPLARAIEEETATHLTRHPLSPPYPWFGGALVFLILLALQFAALALPGIRRPVDQAVPASAQPAEADVRPPEAPPELPTPMPAAVLRWVEPLPEITATAHESVPLVAEADCPAGLEGFSLRLTLAGESVAPWPQPGRLAPGLQSMSLALDLATVNARAFAIVTYHLEAVRMRGQVNAGTPDWPVVFSPLQVIQIRPMGSDLTLEPPPGDDRADSDAERLLFQLQRLKLAQIAVLRAAFALGHDMPARTDPAWSGQIQAVAAQERVVWQDALALLPQLKRDARTAAAVEPFGQAHAEIETAWDALARSDALAAFAPADRGLARIVDAERVLAGITEALADEAAAAAIPEAVDAIRPTPREQTVCGRLEQLASAQQALADELARGEAKDAFARQDRICRALPKLAADPAFPPTVASAINSAAADATEAARHLNDRDPDAATEPATRAAQTLAAVVGALDATGRERAAEVLTEAQRELIRASLDVNDGNVPEATSEYANARQRLAEEAAWQQENGSAEAARQLSEQRSAMDESKAGEDLATMAKKSPKPGECTQCSQKLTELAERAAKARKQLQDDEDRARALAQAADALRRAQANVERAAQQGGKEMRDLLERAQEKAQETGDSLPLPPPPAASEGPPSDPGTGADTGSSPGDGKQSALSGGGMAETYRRTNYAADLGRELARVVELLAAEQRQISRPQVLTTATPSEAPPDYRPAVADYFEALAREAATGAPAPTP